MCVINGFKWLHLYMYAILFQTMFNPNDLIVLNCDCFLNVYLLIYLLTLKLVVSKVINRTLVKYIIQISQRT